MTLGPKIRDKLSSLSKICLFMECLRADFSQFFGKNVNIWLLLG